MPKQMSGHGLHQPEFAVDASFQQALNTFVEQSIPDSMSWQCARPLIAVPIPHTPAPEVTAGHYGTADRKCARSRCTSNFCKALLHGFDDRHFKAAARDAGQRAVASDLLQE